LAVALTPAARRKRCQLFSSDMKLRLDFAGQQVFYYPDLMLACDPHDREPYFRRHPCLIVEVLSESTERIDRREKLLAYQTLPSLQAYWLVAQDAPRIEVYRRAQGWLPVHYTAGQTLAVDCLEAELGVDEVYQDVEWGAGT
jgi:Uma2 family endonuclease